MEFIKKAEISYFLVIVVILVLINFFWLKSAILGLILAVFWLLGIVAGIWGAKLAPNENNLIQKAMGLIFSIAIIMVLASAAFYIFNLNSYFIIAIFLLINLIIWWMGHKNNLKPRIELNFLKVEKRKKINLIIYLILFVVALIILLASQSDRALLSPWEVVPKSFLIIYFLMSAVLIKILTKGKDEENLRLKLILISLHYFLTFSIAWLIYKIGFGFDPFVHRAAEFKLMELGYILPKPFYYIGQYSLVVFFSKLFVLPLSLIDKILVPFLAALTLPGLSYDSLKNIINNKKILLVAILSLLTIITTTFFYSVPQSLANLLLLILVLLSFKNIINQEKIKKWYLLILLAIFVTHPLSGVAALLYLMGIIFFEKQYFKRTRHGAFLQKNNKLFTTIILLGLSVILPIFFILSNLLNGFSLNFTFNNLKYLQEILSHSFNYLPFYSIYHLIYFYEYNWLLLLIIILIIGAYYFTQHHFLDIKKNEAGLFKKQKYQILKNQGRILILLIINLILLSLFEFKLVINYEQGEFIKRFGQIIVLVLMPFVLMGSYFISYKISKLKTGKYILAGCLAGILTIGIYLAYPHDDAFVTARGYAVSVDDIQAVQWINQDGLDANYIVLANQSVSAAGLQEFGFKKYYNNLFYYPIPTSSPLYDIYLKMVYNKPSLDLIQQAADLTDVKRIYFVINDYWLDSQKIVAQASKLADAEKNIHDRVWIFEFDVKE